VFKKIIYDMCDDGIIFEFIAFEDIKNDIDIKKNIKIWGLKRSISNNKLDNRINTNVYTKRDMVLIDHQDKPFFGYEFIKIEELYSYVGAVHCRCKEGHVDNIHNALENLKSVANPPK
jgi:hypothetical protein